MEKVEVIFQPDGLKVSVKKGIMVSDAMKAAGMKIQLPCGGAGKCGKCAVEIHPDAPEPTDTDRNYLTDNEIAQGMRLACRTPITHSIRILVNPNIRVMGGKILVDGVNRTFHMKTQVRKRYVELPKPTLEDQVADLYRVKRALGFHEEECPDFNLDLLTRLPFILRDSDFKVTVVFSGKRILDVEPGDTTGRLYGIAFDIGTTTVVGTIMDLNTGRELTHASRLNAQVVYGEDIISRIKYVMEHENGQRDMYDKIRGVINEIITEASTQAGIGRDNIYEAVFAGNTTMSHLLLGLNPTWLAQIPFTPVTSAAVKINASEAAISINPHGNVYVLPNIAGFVGADTVAVMLACDYLKPGPTQLAVDVGTNGELALRHNGMLKVCSTAAGPALEGASLTCGMRASNGAVEHVSIFPDRLEYDVIGSTAPIGFCGSGIIDMLAELLEVGIVDNYGVMGKSDVLREKIPEYLLKHLVMYNNEPAFLLYKPRENGEGSRHVILSQRDVRQIQLAKGAIRAGINLIVREMGLTVEDLNEILLAGAFGNYIKKSSAQRIGLLPDIPSERIRFVGNAASTGAKMALLSCDVRRDADKIRQMTEHIELAALPGFNDEFMNAMLFP